MLNDSEVKKNERRDVPRREVLCAIFRNQRSEARGQRLDDGGILTWV